MKVLIVGGAGLISTAITRHLLGRKVDVTLYNWDDFPTKFDGKLKKEKDLIRHGGYFPNADHHIPPDAPYEAVKYWLNEIRKLGTYPELRYQVP